MTFYQIVIEEEEYDDCLYSTNKWCRENPIVRWEHDYIKKQYTIDVELIRKSRPQS